MHFLKYISFKNQVIFYRIKLSLILSYTLKKSFILQIKIDIQSENKIKYQIIIYLIFLKFVCNIIQSFYN